MNSRLSFAAVLLAASSAPAFGQSGSATGTGSLTVIQPLTVTKDLDLRFGTIVRPSSGSGTVTVSPAGTRGVSGGVAQLSTGDTPQAGQFTINGEGGQSVSVTIPSSFSIAHQSDMLAVTVTTDLTGAPASQTLSGATGTVGSLIVKLGGSVPITSTTPSGLYTGSFTVTAAYN